MSHAQRHVVPAVLLLFAAAGDARCEEKVLPVGLMIQQDLQGPPVVFLKVGGVDIRMVPAEGQDDGPDELAGAGSFTISDRSFDDVIFGKLSNANDAWIRLRKQLQTKIESVERERRLAPMQKEKLALAGQGDIVRVLASVEEARNC